METSRTAKLIGPRRAVELLQPRWSLVAAVAALTGMVAATTVAYAWLAGPLLSSLRPGAEDALPSWLAEAASADDSQRLALIAAGLILSVTIVRGLSGYGAQVLNARLAEEVVRKLRERLYGHLLCSVPAALLHERRGDLASRVSTDVTSVRSLLSSDLVSFLRNAVTIIALSIFAFRLDAALASIVIALMAPSIVVVIFIVRAVRRQQRRRWVLYGRLVADATEMVGMIPLLRAYDVMGPRREAFGDKVRALEEETVRLARLSAVTAPVTQLLSAGGLVLALGAALARVHSGELDDATFVSLFATFVLLYPPVLNLAQVSQRLTTGLVALERVASILDLEQEHSEGSGDRTDTSNAPAAPPRLRERIELRGVRFSYGDGPPALDGVDLTIDAGEALALVGPSGAGKTTLLLLLLGLLRPDEGTITIDGVDVESLSRHALRAHFAWVTQTPLLFADSVVANIAIGERTPDRRRVSDAARDAGIAGVVESLPDGYDTELSEGAAELSGGEQQRLCIARALYRQAPVLLLDEATSSLDAALENEVLRTLESLLGERTLLLISHQLNLVQQADRVVVLDGGRIVEDGPPAALLASDSALRTLFGGGPVDPSARASAE